MRTSTVAALLRLSSVPADEGWDWLEDILRIDSEALEVARVSYWSLHADPARIFCELCYIAPSGVFERGAVLDARTSPIYFGQLNKLQLIDAADARADPRTRELGPYLEANHIGARLDASVFIQNRLTGILCHEHVGGSRAWSSADQEFALAISQTVVARLEAHARNQSQEAERRATFLSEVAPALAAPVVVEEVAEIAVRQALPILGEMATLVAYEGSAIRYRSVAHITDQGQGLLADWKRRDPPSIESLHLTSRVLREARSLIIPVITPEAQAAFATPGSRRGGAPAEHSQRHGRSASVPGEAHRRHVVHERPSHLRPGRSSLRRGLRAPGERHPGEHAAVPAGPGGDPRARRVRDARVPRAANAAHRAARVGRGDPPAGEQGRRRVLGVPPPARDDRLPAGRAPQSPERADSRRVANRGAPDAAD